MGVEKEMRLILRVSFRLCVVCSRESDSSVYTLDLGSHFLSGVDSPQVTHTVAEVFVHPDYQDMVHDVALLRLEEAVTYSSAISPVCLADGYSPAPGTVCTVTGWGRMEGEVSFCPDYITLLCTIVWNTSINGKDALGVQMRLKINNYSIFKIHKCINASLCCESYDVPMDKTQYALTQLK